MVDIRRLPIPVTEEWDWQMRGACRGMRSSLFFCPERERGRARAEREALAKAVCRECPVLQQCRVHALAVREPYGVWGGLSPADRAELVRAGQVSAGQVSAGQVSAGQVSAHTDRTVVIGVDFGTGRRRGEPAPTQGPWPA
jgi:WhiB family transcriptional regulator, redox-sensing transcriptional regulator